MFLSLVIYTSLDFKDHQGNYPNCLKQPGFDKTRELMSYYEKKYVNKSKIWFSEFNKMSEQDLYKNIIERFSLELSESELPKNFIKFTNTNLLKLNKYKYP